MAASGFSTSRMSFPANATDQGLQGRISELLIGGSLEISPRELHRAADVAADVAGCVAGQGFESLDISIRHAQRAGRLSGDHRDPFDRMLIAQAQMEDVSVVSDDGVFDVYGVSRVW